MKYSLFALAGASLALANPLEERAACSVSGVNSGVSLIQSAAAKLDADFQAIKSTDGSDINLSTFLNDSQNLIKTIQNQTTAVNGCSPGLNGFDASQVQCKIIVLISSVSQLASDIIAKKVPISSRGLAGVVKAQASSQKSAADAYGTAVASKVPSSLGALATSDIAFIDTALASVFAAFP